MISLVRSDGMNDVTSVQRSTDRGELSVEGKTFESVNYPRAPQKKVSPGRTSLVFLTGLLSRHHFHHVAKCGSSNNR
jgi:hypothetical protein